MIHPDELSAWATAERHAVRAEETVRIALRNHEERGETLPSLEMQRTAKELRKKAEDLFHVIYAQTKREAEAK